MRRSVPAVGFILAAVSAMLGLLACGGSNTGNISSIAISPTSANVQIGTESEFTATVNLQNSTTTTDTAVVWEVNGTAGGSTSVGTIVASTTDPEVGIYTAPTTIPAVNNGQVNITAVSQVSTTTTTTGTTTTTSGITPVTSNTAVVTITATGLVGLSVTPITVTVPAGGAAQFAATQNGATDTNVVWSVSSANGGNVGTIGTQTGVYTAPPYPPPGGMVTITATDGTNSSTSLATITYSDHSLNGPYAFSYRGNDASGFRAVAGSFVADGNGDITEGVEDVESSLTGIANQVTLTGTYKVGTDGRTTVTLNPSLQTSATLQFALTTNTHGLMIRFNSDNTGSGTVDQQNLNALTTLPSGPFVFRVSGTDASFNPLGMAGEFFASNGTIAASANSILDVNDSGSVTRADRTLSGTYALDTLFPDTGRGIITLTSTTTGSRQYAFYMIDGTHLYLVEIDGATTNIHTAGDVYTSPSGNSFAPSSLTGNYVFTAGGNSGANSHISGGVFTSSGAGSVTAGIFDSNGGGSSKLNTTISSCAYSVDSATGRVDLSLFLATGTCAPGANTAEFAMYPTAQSSAVLLELDSSAVATGMAYSQASVTSPFTANFAFNVGGQGLFHSAPNSYPPDTEGQMTLSGSGATAGNLDINVYNSVYASDIVNTSGTVINAPATNGRGTIVLVGTNPLVTYNLIYYIVNTSTALLFDQDTTRVALGAIALQY